MPGDFTRETSSFVRKASGLRMRLLSECQKNVELPRQTGWTPHSWIGEAVNHGLFRAFERVASCIPNKSPLIEVSS